MGGRTSNRQSCSAGNQWNAALYDSQHSFVWRYGVELIELLAPQQDERILDLGCGTGHLAQQIRRSGAEVIGLDRSLPMLAEARRSYPQLWLVAADATAFAFLRPFDAVFSNATLHWIPEPEQVVRCVAHSLRPGGRFVAEFGGKGNIQRLRAAVHEALEAMGYPEGRHWNPKYFPDIAEYVALLQEHGFAVRLAKLFDRPTPLEGGAQGLRNWLAVFEQATLSRLPPHQRSLLVELAEKRLRPHLFRDGYWIADYVRLRVHAIRAESSVR